MTVRSNSAGIKFKSTNKHYASTPSETQRGLSPESLHAARFSAQSVDWLGCASVHCSSPGPSCVTSPGCRAQRGAGHLTGGSGPNPQQLQGCVLPGKTRRASSRGAGVDGREMGPLRKEEVLSLPTQKHLGVCDVGGSSSPQR